MALSDIDFNDDASVRVMKNLPLEKLGQHEMDNEKFQSLVLKRKTYFGRFDKELVELYGMDVGCIQKMLQNSHNHLNYNYQLLQPAITVWGRRVRNMLTLIGVNYNQLELDWNPVKPQKHKFRPLLEMDFLRYLFVQCYMKGSSDTDIVVEVWKMKAGITQYLIGRIIENAFVACAMYIQG